MTAIRPLTPDDADSYAALRVEMLADAPWAFAGSNPHDDPPSDPANVRRQLMEPENAILGAVDGGRVVASTGVRRNTRVKFRHIALVWGVYVCPAYRGQGLGRRVVQAALGTARAWPGVASARLSCSTRSTSARAMYESLGFAVWGVEPDCIRLPGQAERIGADELHMVLMF